MASSSFVSISDPTRACPCGTIAVFILRQLGVNYLQIVG